MQNEKFREWFDRYCEEAEIRKFSCTFLESAVIKQTMIDAYNAGNQEYKSESEVKIEAISNTIADEIMKAIVKAIGWTYADACAHLDKNIDYRQVEVPTILERAFNDLTTTIFCKEVLPEQLKYYLKENNNGK